MARSQVMGHNAVAFRLQGNHQHIQQLSDVGTLRSELTVLYSLAQPALVRHALVLQLEGLQVKQCRSKEALLQGQHRLPVCP